MRQMIMKTTKIFSILAVLALVLTGCQDDFGKNFKPAEVGDEIFFGGTSGYEPDGRTVYGDKTSTGTEIMWYAGDTVRIYCAEANKVEGKSYCDYTVNNVVPQGGNPSATEHEDKNSSTLTSAEAYGLQWGEGADANGTHYFYGVYPSPRMFAAGSPEATNYNLNGKTLTAYLPSSQDPKSYVAAKDGNYTIHPAMRYAYMTASATANHTSEGVTMSFTPIVTAVEISIVNNSNHIVNSNNSSTSTPISISNISGVRVSTTDNSVISGRFTANIETNEITSVEGNNYVTVSVRGEDNYPITLAPGKKLTFTVFMVRDESQQDNIDLEALKVSLLVNGEYKTATLHANGTDPLLVYAKKKNFINNVPLELNTNTDVQPVALSKWMSQIKGDTPIGKMSIPGAGGAASMSLGENVAQQTISITELWERGIRAFEFFTHGNQLSKIVCNGNECNKTLSAAIDELKTLISNNPTEFAIAIVGYQPINDDWTDARNSADWCESFTSYWNSVTNGFTGSKTIELNGGSKTIQLGTEIFNPTLRLDDARGKLFCFSRPTTIGLEGWWYSVYDNAQNVIPVLGWGVSPDQFQARGYITKNHPYLLAQQRWELSGFSSKQVLNDKFDESQKQALRNQGRGKNYLYPNYNTNSVTLANNDNSVHRKVEHGDVSNKFMFRTMKGVLTNSNVSSTDTHQKEFLDPNLKIYVQDWRRIAKSDFEKIGYKKEAAVWGSAIYTLHDFFWRESLQEKKDDIVQALIKATTATDYENTIYINSICGFYIIDNPKSYMPTFQRLRFNAEKTGDTKDFTEFKYSKYYESNTQRNTSYNTLGGTVGDIASAAKDLNKFFYDKLLEIGADNLSGPTGIVLMDRVKYEEKSEEDKPGYYLPQIIISNCIRQFGQISNDNIQ